MKYYLMLFAIGLIIGLFISFTYYSNRVEKQLSKWEAAAPKQLQAKVKVAQKVFDQKSDSFQRQNVSLQAALKTTKKELETAKEKVYSLHQTLYELLDERYESAAGSAENEDAACDTLAHHVADLMQASIEKDSLYDSALTNLEQQVENRDSSIAIKDLQYREIKAAFTTSIESQEGLVKQNKLLDKKIRGQRLKSKLLSGALLVVTGVATAILLQR